MKKNRKKRNLKKVNEAGCSNEAYKSPKETLEDLKAGITAKKKRRQERKDNMGLMLDDILDRLSKIL